MLTSSNDDPALVAKQLNTKQGCLSLGAMMGQYKIVDNVLVAVMKKHVPEKKKTANLGRRGRARREEYVFEVPEQVGLFRDAVDHSVWLWIYKCCPFNSNLSGLPSGVSDSWFKLAYFAGKDIF